MIQGQSSTKCRLHASLFITICHNRSWLLVMLILNLYCFGHMSMRYKPIINVFIRLYKCMQREYLLLLVRCIS